MTDHTVKNMKMMVGSSSNHKNTELTEDVLIEIFLHLPLKSIFKFRCVSNLWLSLLSNPFFMNRWIIFNNFITSPPWTLIYSISPKDHNSDIQSFSTASPNLHSSQFISDHDGFSFRFLYSNPYPYLLASSNGLVLCSTSLNFQRRYYVCNPLTKKYVSLPRPPNTHILVLNGLICESSSSSSSLASTGTYKVVRIPEFERGVTTKFDVEVFSSDSGEWNTYKVSCPRVVTWECPINSKLVTHNGVLYWIERQNRIIAYDPNNDDNKNDGHQCRLIDLPENRGDDDDDESYPSDSYCCRCLGESEGFICYTQIQRIQRTLSIWVLEEDYSNGGGSVWHLMHKNIELKIMDTSIKLLAINPMDQNVVILDSRSNILAYNILTGTSEVLHCPSFLANHHSISSYVEYGVSPFVLKPRPTTIPPPSWRDTIY